MVSIFSGSLIKELHSKGLAGYLVVIKQSLLYPNFLRRALYFIVKQLRDQAKIQVFLFLCLFVIVFRRIKLTLSTTLKVER